MTTIPEDGTADAFSRSVAILVIAPALSAAATSYPVMLGLGIVHHTITTTCPAPGFWATTGIMWAASAITPLFRAIIRGK